ncbi:MAG: hypothetical protein Q7O66_05880, partial [Dehalococcoidia bacterium]|nr:hypothetical protein [Dehalococcoidia bacterium]
GEFRPRPRYCDDVAGSNPKGHFGMRNPIDEPEPIARNAKLLGELQVGRYGLQRPSNAEQQRLSPGNRC